MIYFLRLNFVFIYLIKNFRAEEVVIPPGQVKKVDTDLRISLPKGTYGRICERSGLALRHKLIVKGKNSYCIIYI